MNKKRLKQQVHNIDDLGRIARRRLPKALFEFIDRGAEDEVTLKRNVDSIKQVLIRQRVGVDVSNRDISATIFGMRVSMPIGIGVTGGAGLFSYEGEKKLARAAAAAGVPYTVGSGNFTRQSDLLPICGDLLWRQLYVPENRESFDYQISLSRELGIKVLQITLDQPVIGNREYVRRRGLVTGRRSMANLLDMARAPSWLFGTVFPYLLNGGLPSVADLDEEERARNAGSGLPIGLPAQDFTWDDIRRLRREWKEALVVKGVSTAEDAKIAAGCGVDGVIVSNHGGRSLDGCVGSFEALPEIVDAVAPAVTVLVDGGFSRGVDVLKAIATGASMVMVGRATLFGLVAGGEEGVTHALNILHEEIDRALALIGCDRLDQLSRTHLRY